MLQTARQRQLTGFTLIELMVALAVAAILLAIAVPSGSRMIQSAQVRGASSEVLTYLMRARSEALTRQENVFVCPSADGVSCSDEDFQTGLIVFADTDLSADLSVGDAIIAQRNAWRPNLSMTAISAAPNLSFNARGFAAAAFALPVFVPDGAAEAMRVCAQRSGRLEVIRGNEAVCPHEI